MSRKSHPIGLRLNYAQTWKYPINLLDLNYFSQREFFTWRWFLGFCRVNYFYLFEFLKLHESRVFIFFSFLFFTASLARKMPRPRKLMVYRTKYFYRSRKIRMKKVKLFRNRYLQKFKLLRILKFVRYQTLPEASKLSQNFSFRGLSSLITRYIPHRRLSAGSWKLAKRYFRKRKIRYNHFQLQQLSSRYKVALFRKFSRNRNRRRFPKLPLKIVHLRFYILRLKTYLEQKLSKYLNKHVVIFTNNLSDGFLVREKRTNSWSATKMNNRTFFLTTRSEDWRTINKQVYSIFKDLSGQFSFKFPQYFISLAYLGCLFGKPEVLLQWLVYSVRIVRKHSLTLTHQKIIDLFTGCLGNLVHLVGLLSGFRCEINGKLNGSERTRKLIVVEGVTVARQRLSETFQYHTEHIPTYAGALGVRLWLKY